ncbi:6-pyruvoyl trahydropterin synthase family protein [Streptomyces peucetius]|uniref:6-pyruvoyl trahydropterin synthase family protein n=1 Tax=Streptomyces peucetius TaxID=1950 RepID=UPI001F1624FD|nr:6-carboxytetrahydropterin synthase [Streptomyces peucetius]
MSDPTEGDSVCPASSTRRRCGTEGAGSFRCTPSTKSCWRNWPDHADGDEFKHWLDATFDHRHLDDAVPGMNPSAENLAWWMYRQWIGRLPELSCVRVSETPRTWATYRGK